MERRLSVNSDSSVEPMDISAKTATTAPFASSPASSSSSSSTSSRTSAAAITSTVQPPPAAYHLNHHLFAAATAPHHNHHHHQLHRRRRRSTDDDDEDADNDEDDDDPRRTLSPRRRYDTTGAAGVVRRENLRKKYRHIKNNNNDVGHHHDDEDDDDDDEDDAAADNKCVDLRRVKTESRSLAEDLSAGAAANAVATTGAAVSGGRCGHRMSAYTCPICEHVSGTQHDFTEHIRTHNNVSEDGQHYVCRICEKVLSSASSLDRHVLVHTGERPFNCKYCHLTFTTNGNMHRHIRTHQQRGDIPGMTTTTAATNGHHHHHQQHHHHHPVQMPQNHHHNQQHANLGDTDSDAANSSDSSRSAHHHNNNNNNNSNHNHNGKRKSVYDNDQHVSDTKRPHKTTTTATNINNNHLIVAEAGVDISKTTAATTMPFSCPACGRSDFSNMLHLEQHMDREHPGIQAKCRCCEAVFKSHKALNAHKCTANSATTTPPPPVSKPGVTHGFKDLTFVDFSSEKFPLIARTLCEDDSVRRSATGAQRFECPKCARAFPCASSADMHAKSCGNRQRMTSETSEEDARRDDFFAHLDLQNKMLHQQQQSGGSASSNNTTLFSSPSQMDTSYSSLEKSSPLVVKQEQQQQQQLRTPISTGQQLHLHHQYQHAPAPRPFDISKDLADIQSMINVTANGAGFMHQHLFEQQLQLQQQQQQLHKTSAVHLPLTPKEQTTSAQQPMSHPRGEEPEEAQDAEFTAEFRKMKLRGEFPCKLCTAVFPNLRALKGHNRIHVSASGPGPFRCNMCPYAIHDKQALVRHMRTHNGDRPYECAICNYAFTTKANCERHLRNRHAKTTRDEVKRAIIYHPSEDSSCDDPVKKMQIYNASYDEIDDVVVTSPRMQQQHQQQQQQPRGGGTTPLSHLKEILTPPSEKSVKIQVKSMDELTRATPAASSVDENTVSTVATRPQVNRAMDFSMDVLDLSKKSVKTALKPLSDDEDEEDDGDNDVENEEVAVKNAAHEQEPKPTAYQHQQQHETTPTQAPVAPLIPPPTLNPLDMSAMFNVQQQQQQLQHHNMLGDIDPAHYLQLSQFYRNFIFPGNGFGLHPMFLPGTFPPPLPPGIGVDQQLGKDLPAHLFGMPPALAFAQPPPPPQQQQQPLQMSPVASSTVQQQQQQQQQQQPAAPFKREAMSEVSPHFADEGDSAAHRPLSMPTQQELTQRMNSLHQAAAAAAAAAAADAAAAAAAAVAASSTPSSEAARNAHSPLSLHSPHPFANHNGSSGASGARGSPSITNTGPVKMVIKNGVLMPKQKQRRYRTERPFACEHCSARFTLRSNMERHIKQQHPQYWAQRQRGGGGTGGGIGPLPGNGPMQHHHHNPYAQQQQQHSPLQQHRSHHAAAAAAGMPLMPSQLISDQVKYAILAQQLKSRSSGNTPSNASDKIPQVGDLESYFAQHHHQQQHQQHHDNNNHNSSLDNANQYYAQMRERERQLQLQHEQRHNEAEEDEEDEDEPSDDEQRRDDRGPTEKNKQENGQAVDDDDEDDDDDNGSELIIDEDSEPEDLSASKSPPPLAANSAAKKVAEDILEQAMRARQQPPPPTAPIKPSEAAPSTPDLVPVAKLIDNANIPFGGFFPVVVGSDAATSVAVAVDHSDEEGLVASGSASESNGSGAEESGDHPRSSHKHHSHHSHHHRRTSTASSNSAHNRSGPNSDSNKKKSAYSLAPNRVSCPYCQRMFPWTSSLRRHILTHTGQKPFKCSHCPLLFTTKSNCDRHLLRKHGDVESAQSLYVPLEDVRDCMLEGLADGEREEEDEDEDEERDDEEEMEDEVRGERESLDKSPPVVEKEAEQQEPQKQHEDVTLPASLEQMQPSDKATAEHNAAIGGLINAELLPFKCHLCDSSFADRIACLDHIKLTHSADFELLAAKGAIETDVSSDPQQVSAEDEDIPPPAIVAAAQLAAAGGAGGVAGGKSGGKYPDYANRKVMCAFCMRRFWSTEDLRRHMRTHSGERPFQCQICQRKFTLKHSMLRHQKKHAHHQYQHQQQQQTQQQLQQKQPNSASDMSDDEAMQMLPGTPPRSAGNAAGKLIPELIPKEMSWKLQLEHGESLVAALRKAHFFRAAAAAAAAAGGTGAGTGSPPPASMEATLAAAAAAASGTSDLIGNLLGISDQGMLSQVLRSSADEAAKLLGVEK